MKKSRSDEEIYNDIESGEHSMGENLARLEYAPALFAVGRELYHGDWMEKTPKKLSSFWSKLKNQDISERAIGDGISLAMKIGVQFTS